MREPSPYEGSLNRNGSVALGRVTSVNERTRKCRVKTMGVPGRTDDLDLYNVRVLHRNWSPEGDESVSMPRIGMYVVVLFVINEPIILGAFPLDRVDGVPEKENLIDLDPGDELVAKTIGGARIVVRAGGAIEVQSTDQCRTYWIPSRNLISTICQNWELETTGGYIRWTFDKKAETTNLRAKIWNGLLPTHAAVLDLGSVPEQPDQFVDLRLGPVTEDLTFSHVAMRLRAQNNGSVLLEIGNEEGVKTTLGIDSQTGNITLETKGSVSTKVEKDVDLVVEGSINAKVTKDLIAAVEGGASVTAKKDIALTTEAKANVSAKGGASVSTDGDASITAKGKATVASDGDASVTAKGKATLQGTGGTAAGSNAAPTEVLGAVVALAGGGVPVARLGDIAIGVGNLGAPVVCTILQGSPKVTSG